MPKEERTFSLGERGGADAWPMLVDWIIELQTCIGGQTTPGQECVCVSLTSGESLQRSR